MMVKRTAVVVAMVSGSTAVITTAAGFFGGIWWGFDLLANYRWQAMWAALISSVLYALFGKGMFTPVFLVAAAINLWLILPAWTTSQPEASGEGTVRVVHVDLSGSLDEFGSIEDWLLDSDADLVLMAGIATTQADSLIAEDSRYVLLSDPGPQQGVAILGRDNWHVDTTFSDDGQPVHTISVPSGTRVVDVVTSWGGMGTSQSSSDALWQRFMQLTDVVEDADNPVTVIGSLGATRWSAASRHLLTNSTLRDATEGSGYLSTWPTSDIPIVGRWIGIPIDIAYVGPELTPLEVIVGPDIGADHLPITIDVSPVAGG